MTSRLLLLLALPATLLTAAPSAAAAPPDAKITLEGAGQRLHFTFGGQLELDPARDRVRGDFTVIVHPLSPPGNTLNVVCRYGQFGGLDITGNTYAFEATGTCDILALDGSNTQATTHNLITIVDVPNGVDAIDIELAAPTGIAVPGGFLDHGNFVVGTV